MMEITHHGYTFGIGTSDWSDHSSAENAQGKVETWLQGLSKEATAGTHAALHVLQDNPDASPEGEDITRIVNSFALDVFQEEGWLEEPSSGHNCELIAL